MKGGWGRGGGGKELTRGLEFTQILNKQGAGVEFFQIFDKRRGKTDRVEFEQPS